MTATSITTTRRDDEHLGARARIGYAKSGGCEEPSSASDVADINSAIIVTLRNVNGPLARYRLDDGALTRIPVLDAEQLHAAAFAVPRDPRSAEYKAGVRAALDFRINGVRIHRPYPAASAQDDAFDGGLAEGHAIWRAAMASAVGGA